MVQCRLRRTHGQLSGSTVTLWLRVADIAIVVFIWFFLLSLTMTSFLPDRISCLVCYCYWLPSPRGRGSVPIFIYGRTNEFQWYIRPAKGRKTSDSKGEEHPCERLKEFPIFHHWLERTWYFLYAQVRYEMGRRFEKNHARENQFTGNCYPKGLSIFFVLFLYNFFLLSTLRFLNQYWDRRRCVTLIPWNHKCYAFWASSGSGRLLHSLCVEKIDNLYDRQIDGK